MNALDPINLLTTIHGSYLYGTQTSNSDYDTYAVVFEGATRQKVTGQLDHTQVNLPDFLTQVSNGVPQALESLWSPVAEVAPEWERYFTHLHPNYRKTLDTFERTICNFMGWSVDHRPSTAKRRLHALRLASERQTFQRLGIFNPRLSEQLIEDFTWSSQTEGRTQRLLLYYDIQPKKTL